MNIIETLKLAKMAIEAHVEYCRGKEDYTLFLGACLTLERIDHEISLLEISQ